MKTLALSLLLAFAALPAAAQTPVTATSGVAFTAPANWNDVVGGVPVVSSYQLDVMTQTPTGALAFSIGLGKPTPDAANLITVKPIAQLGALAQGTYVATVSAVGPSGRATSLPSDPFVRVGLPLAPGKPTLVVP